MERAADRVGAVERLLKRSDLVGGVRGVFPEPAPGDDELTNLLRHLLERHVVRQRLREALDLPPLQIPLDGDYREDRHRSDPLGRVHTETLPKNVRQ
jgi:hypothetical protein